MSQEIRKARLRELNRQTVCIACRKSPAECGCGMNVSVPIAYKRVKEGLGAVRD